MRAAGALFRLLGPDGAIWKSPIPGTFRGNRRRKTSGRRGCPSAICPLPRGYARHRVSFLDEPAAIAAGRRPCGRCLPARHREWKDGGLRASSA